jgi:uncharacterized membrane protein YbhN (UPF0104 family)
VRSPANSAPSAARPAGGPPPDGRPPLFPRRWLSWALGLAAVAAIIVAAVHLSEGREFVRLARGAEPGWLLVALVLQAATYLAQGEVWRVVARAARLSLSRRAAWELSLAKLFVDQALPSGGISGTVLVAEALEQRGMARAAVSSAVVLNTVSHYAAYVMSLAAALAVAAARHQASALLALVSAAFVVFAIALTATVLAISGRPVRPTTLARRPSLRRMLDLIADADPRLSRDPRLLLESVACQQAIVLLDAATVWVLIRALGGTPSPSGVFASFMISSLFRTVGVLPGGLGTFEASSVLTLKMIGVSLPIGLSATLLFRGLSFWLPMLPGLWYSRRAVAAEPAGAAVADLGLPHR